MSPSAGESSSRADRGLGARRQARRAALALAVATASLCAARSTVRASDHLDGPRASADPQADITDVFAFTSPEDPARVVFILCVTPFASNTSTFSAQVDYVFRVRRLLAPHPLTLDTTPLDVTCTFDQSSPQHVKCTTAAGQQATATVGDPAGGATGQSPLRVFAGLRSDPAFFDRQGALSTVASGRDSFTGQNAFAGANVLAIVVEIDVAALAPADAGLSLLPEGGSPIGMIAVAAETVRKGR